MVILNALFDNKKTVKKIRGNDTTLLVLSQRSNVKKDLMLYFYKDIPSFFFRSRATQ